MTKQKWLEEVIFVDELGRDYNLSDIPMTLMPREKAFKKRKLTEEQIDKKWENEQRKL